MHDPPPIPGEFGGVARALEHRAAGTPGSQKESEKEQIVPAFYAARRQSIVAPLYDMVQR
jgi:hypothetical protein